MPEPTNSPTPQPPPRDAAYWAKPTPGFKVGDVSPEANDLNVEGRAAVGPLMGFGQLWQKTYRIRLGRGVTAEQVVKAWKENLPNLMPANSRFYPSLTGVAPGEVVLINATLPGLPGGVPVSTGVRIIYADDVSFTVMTPAGHPEAGFNTFSAFEEGGRPWRRSNRWDGPTIPSTRWVLADGGRSSKRPSGATC